MRLVGMLDSPYVRRAAISLECLGVAFAHEAVSVFSTFDRFHAIKSARLERTAEFLKYPPDGPGVVAAAT